MKLPEEINYAEAYLTLKCNLGCSYCINDNDGVVRTRVEMSGDDWVSALNKVDFGEVPLTLGGGEPTQHRDFFKLAQQIAPMTKLDLLTNLEFNPQDLIHNISPNRFIRQEHPAYKAIRVSYHVDKMDADKLMNKVRTLTEVGFPVGIFGINHPHNIEANMNMAELARKNQVYFFVKDFLGEFDGEMYGHYQYPQGLDGKLKPVLCKSKELLMAPDGLVYKCHRDLYTQRDAFAHVSEHNFTDKLGRYRECNNFGRCNPCDLKRKTNRMLDMGHCAVEVVE